MALENLNNSNREFKSLRNSFQDWDAGTPSSDVWENLEADLAVSAVWDRLDETLEQNGSPADKALVESYENWSPNNSGDGWSKLEEQLSRERVWKRLHTTLSYPVTTRIPWVKMAAASVLFVFLAFYTDRYTISSNPGQILMAFNKGENGLVSETQTTRQLAETNQNEHTVPVNETTVPANKTLNEANTVNANAQKRLVVSNEGEVKNNTIQNQINKESEPANLTQNNAAQSNSNQSNTAQNTSDGTDASSVTTNLEDLASLDELGRKDIQVVPGTIGDFNFLPFNAPFRPHFSVLVGGQFSFINEKNRGAFSSSLPSMGIAADFQYHAYLGRVRFTQDLGFSQYAQSNGSYVNGRYTNSNQKLNTLYFMSSIGYTFKGITVSGGLALNRLLNGYEQSRTAITNVYNSNKLQLGATAGVDYHFTPFKNKTALGAGVQYQFVSKLKSGNAMFNDIQGVKLQIKYSF